ncbi:MAG TPA: amidohydrolase family protein [Candidatus Eisenbacteria bacterium]|nr:amidohydrolase family protein [Candidatus Eisenbacteria bacterium]
MIVGPCTIVTGGPEPQVLEGAAVRVVGAHIAQLGAPGDLARAHPDETLWPARGRVLMPGLVNTHAHLARHLARGLGLRAAAEWRRYDRALAAEDVHWAVTAALVEGVRHGITTVVDFHRSGACLDFSLTEVTRAAERLGVRLATCYGAAEDDTPLERRAALDESTGFAREIAAQRKGRLCGLLGVQASTLRGVETLLAEALESAGDRLAVHVDLALDLTPGERWANPAALPGAARPVLWAHAERAPRGLLGAVRERGDALTATGVGPAAALLRETEVGWGSDDGVHAPPLPDGALAPGVAQAWYRRLFVTGARWAAAHFGEELGVIAPGAPADLVLLDYRPATEFSTRTLGQHLGAGLLRAPVAGAMVAGRVLLDNGALVAVDEREVAARARACAQRVWSRLG